MVVRSQKMAVENSARVRPASSLSIGENELKVDDSLVLVVNREHSLCDDREIQIQRRFDDA